MSRVPLESGLKLDLNDLVRRRLIRPAHPVRARSLGLTTTPVRKLLRASSRPMRPAPMTGFQTKHGAASSSAISINASSWCLVRAISGGGNGTSSVRTRGVARRCSGSCQALVISRAGSIGGQSYRSQCSDWVQRAHMGKARIKKRLCEIGGFDPERETGLFPPKPKWMRWRTYDRAVQEQFDRYDEKVEKMGPEVDYILSDRRCSYPVYRKRRVRGRDRPRFRENTRR